jgi:hypothetical protein
LRSGSWYVLFIVSAAVLVVFFLVLSVLIVKRHWSYNHD